MLFSDIRGFSTLAERLAARESPTSSASTSPRWPRSSLSHGGTIDKFQGDAVMAVFGAPEPTSGSRRAGAALRDRDAGAADAS